MNNAHIDRWLPVLDYWVNVKDRRSLSFSLLVGATREPIGEPFSDEHSARAYSEALYERIANHHAARFGPCDDVIGKNTPAVFLDGHHEKNPSFQEVWASSRECITSGKFSVLNDACFEIGPDQKTWIREALRRAGVH